jgi:H+-transporting ATPase
MKKTSNKFETPGSKPDLNSNTKDDLKSLPMSEVQTKLGFSADGLTKEEAQNV